MNETVLHKLRDVSVNLGKAWAGRRRGSAQSGAVAH